MPKPFVCDIIIQQILDPDEEKEIRHLVYSAGTTHQDIYDWFKAKLQEIGKQPEHVNLTVTATRRWVTYMRSQHRLVKIAQTRASSMQPPDMPQLLGWMLTEYFALLEEAFKRMRHSKMNEIPDRDIFLALPKMAEGFAKIGQMYLVFKNEQEDRNYAGGIINRVKEEASRIYSDPTEAHLLNSVLIACNTVLEQDFGHNTANMVALGYLSQPGQEPNALDVNTGVTEGTEEESDSDNKDNSADYSNA